MKLQRNRTLLEISKKFLSPGYTQIGCYPRTVLVIEKECRFVFAIEMDRIKYPAKGAETACRI